MQLAIQIVHNTISVVFLLSAGISIWRSYFGFKKKRDWLSWDYWTALTVVITMYLQMLIGFYLFFSSQYLVKGSATDMPSDLRFWPVEHFFIMLFALLVAQIGIIIAINSKKSHDKHRMIFRYYTISIFFVFASLAMIFLG